MSADSHISGNHHQRMLYTPYRWSLAFPCQSHLCPVLTKQRNRASMEHSAETTNISPHFSSRHFCTRLPCSKGQAVFFHQSSPSTDDRLTSQIPDLSTLHRTSTASPLLALRHLGHNILPYQRTPISSPLTFAPALYHPVSAWLSGLRGSSPR